MHHADIVKIDGQSYRLRESQLEATSRSDSRRGKEAEVRKLNAFVTARNSQAALAVGLLRFVRFPALGNSHYDTHIAPAIGGKHVRDWTAVEMRALSRYLDEQIQGGHIAWKTARNVWTTAGKMLARTRSVRSVTRSVAVTR